MSIYDARGSIGQFGTWDQQNACHRCWGEKRTHYDFSLRVGEGKHELTRFAIIEATTILLDTTNKASSQGLLVAIPSL